MQIEKTMVFTFSISKHISKSSNRDFKRQSFRSAKAAILERRKTFENWKSETLKESADRENALNNILESKLGSSRFGVARGIEGAWRRMLVILWREQCVWRCLPKKKSQQWEKALQDFKLATKSTDDLKKREGYWGKNQNRNVEG